MAYPMDDVIAPYTIQMTKYLNEPGKYEILFYKGTPGVNSYFFGLFKERYTLSKYFKVATQFFKNESFLMFEMEPTAEPLHDDLKFKISKLIEAIDVAKSAFEKCEQNMKDEANTEFKDCIEDYLSQQH